MICPRCGFPESVSECQLCQQTDLDRYELDRYKTDEHPRFEITVVFSSRADTGDFVNNLPTGSFLKKTQEIHPRYFVFFPDGADGVAVPVIQLARKLPGFQLLINGRPRPYTEELWLPLLQILKG